METNIISLRRLKTFLTTLESRFAEKKHSHATSDITNLDNTLSKKINYVTLAQEEYDSLETKDPNTAYFIKDTNTKVINGVRYEIMSQEEYDSLTNIENNVIYFIS